MRAVPSFATPSTIDRARAALRESGVLLVPDVCDAAWCAQITAFVDEHVADARTEVNYNGTEHRIWAAEKRHEMLAGFLQECDRLVSAIERRPTEAHTLLAIRNAPIQPDDPRVTMGRWHIDSFFRQVKVFLFLTDTSERTGPFEYIPRTHRPSFKLRMLLKGIYLSPRDVLTGTRAYSQLADDVIQQYASAERGTPVICRAGTLMIIDTTAIHRARPCLEGGRYALTAYYR